MTTLLDHGEKEDQLMFQHVLSCEEFNLKLILNGLADIFSGTRTTDHMEHVYTVNSRLF